MNHTTNKAIAAAIIALAATLAACTDGKQPSGASPTTATPASTSPSAAPTSAVPETAETAKQRAIDAYVGMQRAFLKAGEAADPAHPDLPRYSTGAALQRLTGYLKTMHDQGLRGRGDAVFYPQIEALSPPATPNKAQIRDCMDTSKTEVFKANGDPYQDEPGGWRLVLADVEVANGTWKVTDFAIREVGSCTR